MSKTGESIRAFLEVIWGDMKGNVVLGLRDVPGPKGKVNRYWDWKYPEQFDAIVKFAEEHANSDLYVSPLIYGEDRNPDTGKVRRIPENALFSNTIYQDSDYCPPEKFRLPPSVHITTSEGKYQDYWVLESPIPSAEAANISHKIAVAHRQDGSDPSSWSANKVLRIPHSYNTTHGFPEDVSVQYSGMVYNSMDIEAAYDDVEFEVRPIIRLAPDVSYDTDQDLPDYSTALDKLPADFDTTLLIKEIEVGQDRSRVRYRLLCDLFRTPGLEFQDVVALAWHAPSSRKWKEDPRNLRGLLQEAVKAQNEIAMSGGINYSAGTEDIPDDLEPEANTEWPVLLTEAERDSIRGDENFISRFDTWTRAKLGRVYNAPYARVHAWQILSAAFCDLGFIPRGNGPEGLNLYSMIVGDSGSGKTSHMKLWRIATEEIFDADKGYYLSTNASPQALHEKLLERDGKTTVMMSDEAHGWFKQVNNQQWSDGIYENLALYYDGDVPPVLRTGNREISGKSARVWFCMHLQGTKSGELSLSNALNRHMFLSGFLARFIWTIGENTEMTEDSLVETQSAGEFIKLGYDPIARQWAREFQETHRRLRAKHNRKYIPMMMDNDAMERMTRVKWNLTELYRGDRNWEILQPSIIRLGTNIRKAATLLALEEGCDTVSLRHTLLAIEAAEEWVSALVIMANMISDSDWKRQTDEILQFIAAKQRVSVQAANRRFDSKELRIFNMQLDALKAQGRVREVNEGKTRWLYAND